MLWKYSLALLILAQGNRALENEQLRHPHTQTSEPDLQQIRSPLLEVFMHLPQNFRSVRSFTDALRVPPQKVKRKAEFGSNKNTNQKSIVDVRNYEISQPVYFEDRNSTLNTARIKREANNAQEVETKPILEKPEPEKLVSSLTGSTVYKKDQPRLPAPDAIRGPMYTTYPVKEFDIVDIDDPDDARRRRTDLSTGGEDNSQRDKRTFLEEGSGETTTPLPFWKRKKESPPFVTGRGGSVPTGNSYTPAQHRSGENVRESHSLKNLDKTVQSNEITRSNQDNYYSSTNRRTYSRQYDSPPSSTPKSVYDTFDYNNKRNTEPLRNEGRNQEEKKESPREIRPQTHEQYTNRQYYPPWMYDRPYYQPAYPYPTEVLGRGVEYYHRTYDPTTGRIIYYANMPEQGRSYDYRYMDPINRSFYLNNRPYPFDPYYRNYVPPFDYRFVNGFGRSGDYIRSGRSGSQAYSYPYQEREKYPRDARFFGGFETGNRVKDDLRNKTYIIYDADERRSQFSRPPYAADNNRLAYTPAPIDNLSRHQVPFKQFSFPPPEYFPPAAFPNRNNYHSSGPGSGWGFNHRSVSGVTDSKSNSRPMHSPEVQLPLTTTNRRDLDKSKKS